MKKTVSFISAIALFLASALCLSSCFGIVADNNVWDDAIYTEDTEFGNGATTIKVEVQVLDNSVTFTINTDKTTLADAMREYELISGEDGPYGLYVKVVNGITADYDDDMTYWSFYKDGEYLMSGADTTTIADGEHYEIVYSK